MEKSEAISIHLWYQQQEISNECKDFEDPPTGGLPVFDDPKVFSKGNVVFDEPSILRPQSYFKWRYGLWWFKGTDDPQVYKWQKVISDGSHDFDNLKAYGDTSIFDGLVLINAAHVTDACLVLDATDHMELTDWQKGGKCPDHETNT